MVRFMMCVGLSFCILASAAAVLARGRGGEGQQGVPGQFDFYVLSLSWAPSFCALERGRAAARRPQAECGYHPYGFVVHGLWPQNNRGYSESCQVPPPRLPRSIVAAMLDLMPAPRLVYNEWDRHGTCSGLSPRDYFATIRQARAAVQIPPQLHDLQNPIEATPAAVEAAFIKANPGLGQDDIAVGCQGRRFTEIRICLSKNLKFRACPDVVAHGCQRDELLIPPLRGRASEAPGGGSH